MTPTSLRLPRGRAYDPFYHADLLGIQVIHRDLVRCHELWLPDHGTIVLKKGMREASQRSALAHGIGHAVLGHVDDHPKTEHQADRYASLYLIDPREYVEACVGNEGDLRQVATELGVTLRLLRAYLTREGTTP